MQGTEIFFLFTGPLDRAKFSYMATGSVASMVYGTPRFTNDLDLVLEIPSNRIAEFAELFPLADFYCPPAEVLTIEAHRRSRGHFNVIHHKTGYKADMYICADDELHHWAMQNRKQITWDAGKSIYIAPPEYVIIEKLIYFREGGSEKHVRDIRGMLAISGELIDYRYMQTWIDKLNLHSQWALVT